MHLVEITKTNLAAAVAELAEKQVVKLGKQASARERAGLLKKAVPPGRGSIEVDLAVIADFAKYSVNQEAPSNVAECPDHKDL